MPPYRQERGRVEASAAIAPRSAPGLPSQARASVGALGLVAGRLRIACRLGIRGDVRLQLTQPAGEGGGVAGKDSGDAACTARDTEVGGALSKATTNVVASIASH